MGKRMWRKVLVTTVLAAVPIVVGGGPAEAAGGPTFVGGKPLAPYTGNLHSSVAYNGDRTLAVWQQLVSGQYDIYGSVMAADSTQVGAAFPIATGVKAQTNPDVAWNGSTWLVVWEQATSATNHDIRGQRVTAAGAETGAELGIATTAADQAGPAIAGATEGRSFVVWEDARNAPTTGLDVYGRRIDGATLLDGTGTRLSFDTADQPWPDFQPDVAWNGSRYRTVWGGYRGDSHWLLTDERSAGGVRSFVGYLLSSTALIGDPAIASDGQDFFVVHEYGSGISGLLVHPGSHPETGIVLLFRNPGTGQTDPAIAFNGTYLVAMVVQDEGRTKVWGTRVDAEGTLVDEYGFLLSDYYPSNGAPALTRGGSRTQTFGLSWDPTPAGQGSGVVAYGVQFAAK